jgi:hypothetical protein
VPGAWKGWRNPVRYTSFSAPDRIERVELPVAEDGEYEDFPKCLALAGFDPSDRKFAAVARRERVEVANATDTDWLDFRAALSAARIHVARRENVTWNA